MPKLRRLDCTLLEGEGETFGGWLARMLGSPDLTEAVIASAYVTNASAEWLAANLLDRPRTKERPSVTVLVGAMNRFTRKTAIRHLLQFTKGGQCSGALRVNLRLLRPPDHFHVKAAYARLGSRKHVAVIGSHNFTEKGLQCEGEMGMVMHRVADAKLVASQLDCWRKNSAPWWRSIDEYRQRKGIPVDCEPQATAFGRGGRLTPTAETTGITETTTKLERRAVVVARKQLKLVAPHAGYDYYFLDSDLDVHAARVAYPDGARFDLSETDTWETGEKRMIARVVRVLPVFNGRQSVVFYKKVLPYTVTSQLVAAAGRLGVKGRVCPRPQNLQRYIDAIAAGNTTKRKKAKVRTIRSR